MVAAGLIALWLVLLLVPSPDLTSWDLLGPLLVAGIGSGLFIAPNAQFIVATVDRAEAGAASGVIGTMQRIGSAIGIAVIGSVFFGMLVFPTDRQPSADDVANAFGTSATWALAVSAAFAVVAFALVFVLPKRVSRGYEVPSAEALPAGVAADVPGSRCTTGWKSQFSRGCTSGRKTRRTGGRREHDGEQDRERDRREHPERLGALGEEAGLAQRVEHEAVQQVDVHRPRAEHGEPGAAPRDEREERRREHDRDGDEAEPQQRRPPRRLGDVAVGVVVEQPVAKTELAHRLEGQRDERREAGEQGDRGRAHEPDRPRAQREPALGEPPLLDLPAEDEERQDADGAREREGRVDVLEVPDERPRRAPPRAAASAAARGRGAGSGRSRGRAGTRGSSAAA